MKSKIFIVAGILIALSIYYASSSFSMGEDFIGWGFGGEKGDGNVQEEIRDVAAFDKAAVKEGLEMVLIPSHEEKVIVVSDSNLLDNITIEVIDGELIASLGESINSAEEMRVEVYYDDMNGLTISSGSTARTEGAIVSADFDVSVSSGADGQLELDAADVYASASSGSSLYLEGKASFADLDASSGSEIEAFDLLSEKANADVSSGAAIELSAIVSLDADASSGGSIAYKGDSVDVASSMSSGGSVSRQ